MAERASIERQELAAAAAANLAGYRRTKRTGLRKACPRCGRSGVVLLVREGGQERALVVWSGRARGTRRGMAGSRDLDCCALGELLEAEFGCGFDGEEPRARVPVRLVERRK